MSGKRYNKGKVRLSLIPPQPIADLAEVLEFGASKYGDHNWRGAGENFTLLKIMDSMERHLLEIKKGNDFDDESGLSHISHVLANAAFISQLKEDGTLIDDRYKKPGKGIMHHLTRSPRNKERLDSSIEEVERYYRGFDYNDETREDY